MNNDKFTNNGNTNLQTAPHHIMISKHNIFQITTPIIAMFVCIRFKL
jgi:hypothetical protein